MTQSTERIIYDLPQIEHLSDSRIQRYVKRLTELGLDIEWHCRRLSGFGGSEVGALLRHGYGAFFDAPGDSFRSAGEIVAEKLLSQLPRPSTPQAQRGTDIEALTREVFRRKYNALPCEEGFTTSRQHSRIKAMRGNIDDAVLVGDKAILVDYKSSQHTYAERPFDYVAQAHHYGAIARSNSFSFSKALIVGIHAPEDVLQGLAKIARERNENPDQFEFWVDALVTRGVPGVELKLYPVNLDTRLMSVIEATVSQIWEQNVLAGKLLVNEGSISLPEETQQEVDVLMGSSSRLLALKSAITQQMASNNQKLQRVLLGVDHKKLAFTKKHPINIGARTSMDAEAAIAALEAQGVDLDSIKSPSNKRDVKKLEEAFVALGGDLSSDGLLEKTLPVNTVRAKLLEHNIDPCIYETVTYAFAESRQKAKATQYAEEVSLWGDTIQALAQQAAIHSPAVSEPLSESSETSMSM